MRTIKLEKNHHICTITLNRPDQHNALDSTLIQELHSAFTLLNRDPDTKIILLTGEGSSFCAGGDLNDMKSILARNESQDLEQSQMILNMLQTIDQCSKPVIGFVNGLAFGGGVGLVSVCDIVLAHENAFFGFSEVKLGLAPSIISPFVIRKIGFTQARRYFITGERFDVKTAKQIGLIHEIVNQDNKDKIMASLIKQILSNSSHAMAEIKTLVKKNSELSGEELHQFTKEHLISLRSSKEAQERMRAFLEKRKK